MPVRVLPDEIANRIAAGEVVERPASVVKELAENSLDAGATRVRVQVRGAGKGEVSVADDGSGMAREDALLALERHATSKIVTADDLERIDTLGFRGEALPSIASVSRFRLLTRRAEDREGTRIQVEGGRLLGVEAAGAAVGTVVEVGDLFYCVPARRKFLKTDATELRNIVETVAQLALTHFDVGFELRGEARTLLAVPPGQSQEERAAEVLGADAFGGLHWYREEAEDIGYALAFAPPHEGRGARTGIRLFVNDRPVNDRLLFRALMEGYRGLLAPNRYPVALLFLRLPPDAVDVNVHPAKREVRLREEGKVFRRIAANTARALAGAPWAIGGGEAGAPAGPRFEAERRYPSVTAEGRERAGRIQEALDVFARRAPEGREPDDRAWASRRSARGRGPEGRGPLHAAGTGTPRTGRFETLLYVGAFDATYLLFEDTRARDLVILDQHAAHERILYERLLEGFAAPAPASQPLLFPLTLECTAGEIAAYEERGVELATLGFEVEQFGSTTLVVKGSPPGWPAGSEAAVVRDVLASEDQPAAAAAVADRREAAARKAACAGAVKARKALLGSEAEALLDRLGTLRNPTHCPHGRPLLLRLSRAEVEGMFRRR